MRRSLTRLVLVLAVFGCTPPPGPDAPSPATSPATSSPAAIASPGPSTPGSSADPGAPIQPSFDPTAADLIEADRARGLIDEPTALLYRVYAIFGDPRLPQPYASAPASEDGAGLYAAQEALATLPETVAAELRPYLVRPTDPTSVFHDIRGQTSAADAPGVMALAAYHPLPATPYMPASAPAVVECNQVNGWGYALGAAHFKVWGECGNATDDAEIQLVAAVVDELWADEAAYLDREPLPDAGRPVPDEWLNDQGGDTRIDIYLVNPCVTRAGACRGVARGILASTLATPPKLLRDNVGVTSSYILVPRGATANQLKFRATMAHELFHAFQNAMNLDGTRDGNDWHWFVEASAVWAEWAFVPSAAPVAVAVYFPWSQDTPFALSSNRSENEYWSFTWPLFMDEEAGFDSVAKAWHAIEGKVGPEALNQAIDGELSFRDNFHVFAMRTWNKELGIGDPMDPLLPEPPTGPTRLQPGGPQRHADITLLPSPPGDLVHDVSESIPGLDAAYSRFEVDPDVGQLILDFNGLFPPAAQDRDALVKIRDKGWEHRELEPGPTTWCMDNPDDDVEELIVIISNHEFDETTIEGDWSIQSPLEPCLSYQVHLDWTDVYDGIGDHFAFDGWVDTIDRDLSSADAIVLIGTGTLSGSRVGWAACNPGIEEVPQGTGKAEFVATIVGDTVTIGAYEAIESTSFGVGTQPFTVPREGGTKRLESRGTVGDLCPHSWFGTLTATLKVKPPP
jgi:hypothetical protein